jgi:hypothetical protein
VGVSNAALVYESVNGKEVAAADVVGVIVNDRGKPAGTFQTRLTVNSLSPNSDSPDNSVTIYNYRVPLTPGLYQVRVATRETKSGRVGSAQQWIEIPNLALQKLSLSSLLLGLQNVDGRKTSSGEGDSQVQFSADHRFAHDSQLRFSTFLYNLSPGNSKSNVTIQARLLRGGQVLKKVAMLRVNFDTQDLTRIPFSGEIMLNSIPSGNYTLEVSVTDQTTKASASQETKITVE